MDKIICVGRQYGSGGRVIAQKLAEKNGIPFYDNALIARVAEESGLSKDLVKKEDEKVSAGIFYSQANVSYIYGSRYSSLYGMSINDHIFCAESQVIKNIANEGPCVILGRCADYVLRERNDIVSVFIYAGLENRVHHAEREYDLSEKQRKNVKDLVLKMDKRRASFYNHYSNARWGIADTYDLCFGSEIGVDKSVELIELFTKIKFDK